MTFDEVKAQIELKKNRKMDKMPMREEVRVLRRQWVKKMREMSRVAKEMPSRAVLDESASKTVLTSQTMHENLFVAQPQQINFPCIVSMLLVQNYTLDDSFATRTFLLLHPLCSETLTSSSHRILSIILFFFNSNLCFSSNVAFLRQHLHIRKFLQPALPR